MSVGADLLLAIKARIESIRTTAGYNHTVKTVLLNNSQPTMRTSEADLPLVEIKDDAERYEHAASANYFANTVVCFFLVGPREWTDGQFQDLMSDVRRCIYGNGAAASGNTGLPISGVQSVELVDAASDLNMVGSNRTYMMRMLFRSSRITYRH